MAISPKIAHVLAKVYDVAEEDVEAVMAANAELARQAIEDGLAAMAAAAPPVEPLPAVVVLLPEPEEET